ncbi:MAG: hypothetical protein WC796_00520 [Candidatus Pacearchaeota archaeon]|jgi:hypothetical protein
MAIRQIKTREEVAAKSKRNQIIVGVILVVVMILSTVGFSFLSKNETNGGSSGSTSEVDYKNVKFLKNSQGLWVSNIDGQEITTYFNPLETENLSITFSTSLGDFYNKPLFFASQANEGNYEILKNLYPFIERSQNVCLAGENCSSPDLVVKNCSSNLIVFRETNNTNIYKSNNCIFIETPYAEQKRAADGVIFKIFGVQ